MVEPAQPNPPAVPPPRFRRPRRGLVLAAIVAGALGAGYLARSRPDPDMVWKTAQADLQSGRFTEARAGLARLTSLRPPTGLDHMLAAQLAIAENRPDQALAELALVSRDHYMAAQARLLAGQIELRRKRLRLAEDSFNQALAIDPNLVQAYRELIFIHGLQLRRPELNKEFQALARLVGLTFDNVHHWCTLRNNSWEPGLVVEHLLDYLAADPEDRYSRLAVSENLRRMGLYDEASTTLKPLPAEDREAGVIRIQIDLDRSDLEEAERALARSPDGDPDLARLRGRALLARGDARAAETCFRAAFAADPDNRDAIQGLAATLDALGRRAQAARFHERGYHLDRLITLILRADDPATRRDAALLRELAEHCASLDRGDEAQAWAQLAIAVDPLDSASQRLLFRIRKIRGTSP